MHRFGKPQFPVGTLEADSIWLEYKNRKVLQNIYIRIDKGQIVGLLGRNGSGKSSLLEIIYGIRHARNSSVRIDGNYVSNLFKHENLLSYLPQHQFVPGYLRVKEALELYRANVKEAVGYFPELCELSSYRFNQLSGGQQRLIETIMAISGPASFVILDEPFSNVTPLHIETLKTWLISLKSDKGILVTDHYYRDVLAISDNVYLLNMEGRTVELQHPAEQLRHLGYIN